MQIEFSIDEIDTIAQKIIDSNPKKVIIFNGNMGTGKTTLIKSICKNLGVKGTISSPTFSLVNEYQTIDNKIVYHFDFYRIKSEVEALDMGIDDYLYSDNWCLIEWPEKIENLLPSELTKISIEIGTNDKRKLTIE